MKSATRTWPVARLITDLSPRGRWVQAGLLIGVWLAADAACVRLGLPLPGSVVGFLVVLLLLESRLLPCGLIERGADGLLDHLVLFFVPAMLALTGHPELVSFTGVKLLAAIVAGTVIVMCGTALVVEAGFRLRRSR